MEKKCQVIFQGHVDSTHKLKKFLLLINWFLRLMIKDKKSKYLMEKASISINGVSLTISKDQKIILI